MSIIDEAAQNVKYAPAAMLRWSRIRGGSVPESPFTIWIPAKTTIRTEKTVRSRIMRHDDQA